MKALVSEEQNWIFVNARGTNLKFSKLNPLKISDNISLGLKNGSPQKLFEAKCAKKLQDLAKRNNDVMTDFSNSVENLTTRKPGGDIDLATSRFIGEAKT